MKLAFCLFKYFPYSGLARDFLRIANACAARGHEVHVYTMQWQGEQEAGITVHLIKARGLQNHTRIQSFAKQVKQKLALQHYDLVVGFNKMPSLDIYYAADVCYEKRVRMQRSFFYRLLPRYRKLAQLERAVFTAGASTKILLLSAQQQKDYTDCYQTEIQRFHLLPPGIAKDRIAPDNASQIRKRVRRDFHLNDEQLLLLMVGSGFKTKGLDRSLAALAALPPALKQCSHLFVIGQDDKTPFLRQIQAANLTNHVHFLGGRHDVPDFLLAADLLIHPSYHENTGTVLLEALAAGLPVLTLDVCGYAHYVTNANAGLVLASPFKQAALNAALEKMLSSTDHALWQKNGISFAKTADIYSLPEKAAELIDNVGRSRVP